MIGKSSPYKILLLGDSTVGKTCFLVKYTEDIFNEQHINTVGFDYRFKEMILKSGKKAKIQIWDTAGQDRFRAIAKNYYKGAAGIILIYDVTNEKSYYNVKTWISQIKESASENVIIYIVGNKIDKKWERKVSEKDGRKLADEYGFPFAETSAKDGININETFEDLVERIDSVFPKLEKTNNKKNQKFYGRQKNGCC